MQVLRLALKDKDIADLPHYLDQIIKNLKQRLGLTKLR